MPVAQVVAAAARPATTCAISFWGRNSVERAAAHSTLFRPIDICEKTLSAASECVNRNLQSAIYNLQLLQIGYNAT
jgi:hypothetical protein